MDAQAFDRVVRKYTPKGKQVEVGAIDDLFYATEGFVESILDVALQVTHNDRRKIVKERDVQTAIAIDE